MQLVPNACLSSYKVSFAVFLYYVRMTSSRSLSLLSLDHLLYSLVVPLARLMHLTLPLIFKKIHIGVPTSLLTS